MASPNNIQACYVDVAEPDQSPPHVVQEPPTNEIAELDYDFVEQPDQDYFCPVSLELLVEPHQTSCCGHHISQQAANRLIRERKPCPMCKEDNFATHEDKFFKRNCINKLKVYCPHKKSECEWTGELGDLNHHTTSCPKRPWKCKYCDYESIYESGPTDHTLNCANYPLPCPNQCEIGIVPRFQADSHLLECPLQLVECEFAGTGCDVKVPRRDLVGHMTKNAQHHLMTATLLNLRLTRELHQKIEEKDQQILELKQQLTEQENSTHYLVGQCDNIETQLDQQKEYLDTKLKLKEKEVQEITNTIRLQAKSVVAELKQSAIDSHEKTHRLINTKLQIQTKDINEKMHREAMSIKEKLQQQRRDFDTKLHHQTEVIDTNLQQKIMALNTKQQKLEAQVSFLTHSMGLLVEFTCHRLTLTEFNQCQAKGSNGSWYSEPFYNYPGGYRFWLNIDTNGFSKGFGTHLSAYLYLLKGDYDDERQWPIEVTARLTMLNQRGDNNHFTCREIVVKYEKVKEDNEYKCISDEYYPLNQLRSVIQRGYLPTQYLDNNSIKFKLELKIKY